MSAIQIFFEDVHPVKIKKNYLKTKVKELIAGESGKIGDISVIFCSDKYLYDINVKYLNHQFYTDIVTFDYVENDLISGDLFISLDRVKENAKNFEVEFIVELTRVVFHGILHLVGYKDKEEDDKVTMRKKEEFYLKEVDFSKLGYDTKI